MQARNLRSNNDLLNKVDIERVNSNINQDYPLMKGDSMLENTNKKSSNINIVDIIKSMNNYKNKKNKYYNINKILENLYFLIWCYKQIKNKLSNITKDKINLDNIDFKWFERISKQLIDGTYKFTNAKQIGILSKNDKYKKLTITFLRDKIVQKLYQLYYIIYMKKYS